MKGTIKHDFNINAEEYFDKVQYNEKFNDWLFVRIDYKSREIIETQDKGDRIERKVKLVPDRDIPAVAKKVIKVDQIEYIEDTTYVKGSNKITIQITPNIFPDKFSFKGELRLIPNGDKKCIREFEMELKLKVFGIGSILEKYIFEQIKSGYEDGAKLTSQYLDGEVEL